LLDSMENSTLLLIEANHDVDMLRMGRYPWWLKKRISGDAGHLSNDAAAEVVAMMAVKGTKRFILGHLSKENNFPELAWLTVSNALLARGIKARDDIILEVALRNMAGMVFVI
jgi:phosphoribosyl 1,2-cyclic phosphodiesterase